MIDIILHSVWSVVEMRYMGNNSGDVIGRNSPSFQHFFIHRLGKALVEPESSHFVYIISLWIKYIAYKLLGIVGSSQISVAESFVYFYIGFISSFGMVFG